MTAPVLLSEKRGIEFFGCAGDFAELSAAMLARVGAVLSSGQVLSGPDVETFERRVAAFAGRDHGIALGSGTDALFFALVCANIGPGDEVLVPAISFVASASAITRTGARPIFVDIGEDAAIDLEHAERLISPATKALLHVHLFGAMSDPEALERFVARHDIALIEDYAQSFGASFDGRPAGSLGLASATSFDPTKVIGAPGSGGALVTDDPAVAARVRQLRLHGKSGDGFVELGYNSQLPSIAAAILNLKLDRHLEWTRRRADIAERYRQAFSDLPIAFPRIDPRVSHIWHKFVLLTERRDALADALKRSNIPVRIHYAQPLPEEPLFSMLDSNCAHPNARDYCRRTLSLPIHSHMTAQDVDQVIAATRAFFA